MLEYIPANFKVIRHVRPKFACKQCERVVEAPAPSRAIERGLAGPGLLAHVLVAKYADHLPLYRQSEIYAREGVDLDRSTLAGWVGAAERVAHSAGRGAAQARSCPRARFTPMTRRFRCSRRATARPRQDACGRMCAMTGQLADQHRSGRVVRLLAGSQGRTSAPASEELQGRVAGRCLRGISSSLWRWPHLRGRLLGARAAQVPRHSCGPRLAHHNRSHQPHRRSVCASKKRFAASRPSCAARFARPAPSRCSTNCEVGWKNRCGNCPQKVKPRARSAMRSRTGARSRATLTMDGWRSTTQRPNGRCAP